MLSVKLVRGLFPKGLVNLHNSRTLVNLPYEMKTTSSSFNRKALEIDDSMIRIQRPCPSLILETASFLISNQVREISLPSLIDNATKNCPTLHNRMKVCPDVVNIAKVEPEEPLMAPLEEPESSLNVPKHAQRMVRIRKRKMKVHQRRKRYKKNKMRYTKKRMVREKNEECEFRIMLMEKVQRAKKFDANKYVSTYLEDMNTPLVPATYKGKRLPTFLIKELIEQDELKKQRKIADRLDIITREPLVREGEKVEDFVQRMQAKHGWKSSGFK